MVHIILSKIGLCLKGLLGPSSKPDASQTLYEGRGHPPPPYTN